MVTSLKRCLSMMLSGTVISVGLLLGGLRALAAEMELTSLIAAKPEAQLMENVAFQESDELFAHYVEQKFYETKPALSISSVGSQLSGNNAKVYSVLRTEVADVASGSRSSCIFEIPVADLLSKHYSAKELGIASIVDDEWNPIAITDEAQKALINRLGVNVSFTIEALLRDCPYELYWFDKESGYGWELPKIYAEYTGSEYRVYFDQNSSLRIYLSVSVDYADSTRTDVWVNGRQFLVKTDTTVTKRASAAAANAKTILAEYQSLPDDEKLFAYRDSICEMTDYNSEAAAGNIVDYGNPWQLVWVFDGDEATNVVCEGYAKAFQYLCDQSSFQEGTSCITVTGEMAAEDGIAGHMWNIVNLKGRNYLADITNSDTGAIGEHGQLFLTGTTDGDEKGYELSWDGYEYDGYYYYGGNVRYVYDESTMQLFSTDERTLWDEDYDPERVVFRDVTDQSLFYYDAVYWAADNGIVTGWADDTFRPLNDCNRAAVVTFLWRMAGKPEPKEEATFEDMTGNPEFDTAIAWASEEGITTGWEEDNTFRPWNTCNRAAIVTFLWRYAGRPNASSIDKFKDMTGNRDFDKAISWAASKGVTTGWDDNTFRPWKTCKRLAIVSFLHRFTKSVR